MGDELLKKRIKPLNTSRKAGQSVVYVMSRDQRVHDNHALLSAQKHAFAKKLPLVVVFVLYTSSGYRSREHYEFMLDGLRQIESSLNNYTISFSLLVGQPNKVLNEFFSKTSPDAVYFDFNPLKGPRNLQKRLASENEISMYVVDTHNIVPCWVVSDKKEFSAATFRPKVHRLFGDFLHAPEDIVAHPHSWNGFSQTIESSAEIIEKLLRNVRKSGIEHTLKSGEQAAHEHLQSFIDTQLENYAHNRNHPSENFLSGLSPYLHFGQISSLRVALELQPIVNGAGDQHHLLESNKMPKPENFSNKKSASIAALLEEMIIRKELSDNYCFYEKNYTKVAGAADWAQETISYHDIDDREHLYSKKQLEEARTHDDAWNAAQRQMMSTGKMHGYMRMYWAKKVKEWTPDAQTAIDILVELNDRYSIDGGDPNGYTGIMWSVCGVHDRPWTERDVFGKIRYMNYQGLKRKFDIEKYQQQY